MFLQEFSFEINNPLKVLHNQEGANTIRLYKIRTLEKKPYHIRLEEYDNSVFFIKFYPANLETSDKKYKSRVSQSKRSSTGEMTRIVATCIKLALKIRKTTPQAIFGFIGQWDEVDVKRKRPLSQRFNIYQRVVASSVDNVNYVHKTIEEVNAYYVVPKIIYSDDFDYQLRNQFEAIFGDNLEDLFYQNRIR